MATIHFISGLPRSGSTLLANILAQNPRFHTTPTSGIVDIMFAARNAWDTIPEFKAAPNDKAKQVVLRAILESYFRDIPQPVIFDKARSWLAHLGMVEYALERKVKVLVPVRDLRDVLASFEKLYRKFPQRQSAQERLHYFDFQTVQGRCNLWLRPDQPVGLAANRVRDAFARGFGDRLHLVEYERLTNEPAETMRGIYDFLQQPHFPHNFNNVEQVTHENDEVHGIPDLHTIEKAVRPALSQWREILGPWAEPIRL